MKETASHVSLEYTPETSRVITVFFETESYRTLYLYKEKSRMTPEEHPCISTPEAASGQFFPHVTRSLSYLLPFFAPETFAAIRAHILPEQDPYTSELTWKSFISNELYHGTNYTHYFGSSLDTCDNSTPYSIIVSFSDGTTSVVTPPISLTKNAAPQWTGHNFSSAHACAATVQVTTHVAEYAPTLTLQNCMDTHVQHTAGHVLER